MQWRAPLSHPSPRHPPPPSARVGHRRSLRGSTEETCAWTCRSVSKMVRSQGETRMSAREGHTCMSAREGQHVKGRTACHGGMACHREDSMSQGRMACHREGRAGAVLPQTCLLETSPGLDGDAGGAGHLHGHQLPSRFWALGVCAGVAYPTKAPESRSPKGSETDPPDKVRESRVSTPGSAGGGVLGIGVFTQAGPVADGSHTISSP